METQEIPSVPIEIKVGKRRLPFDLKWFFIAATLLLPVGGWALHLTTTVSDHDRRIMAVELATASNTRDITEMKAMEAQTLAGVNGMRDMMIADRERSSQVDGRQIDAMHAMESRLQQQITGLYDRLSGRH